MFSDASKNPTLGYGGICGDSWMFRQWDENFLQIHDPSIAYLELYALTATILNWVHRFKNKRIILFCDNQSVVQMINQTSSSCKQCMVLIRMIVLKSLNENVCIFAKYIKSSENKVADFLSRLKLREFAALSDKWEKFPTETLRQLVPMHKLWLED